MATAHAQTKVSPKIKHGALPEWDWELDPTKQNTLRYNGRNVYRERNWEPCIVDQHEQLIRGMINAKWSSRLSAYRALKAASTSQGSFITVSELLIALKRSLDLGTTLTDDQILAVLDRWDVNQDSVLDWEEFSAAIKTEETNRNYNHFGASTVLERTSLEPTDFHGGTTQRLWTEPEWEAQSRINIDNVERIDAILSVLKRKIHERWHTTREAFLEFDANREGFISPRNWNRVLSGTILALGVELTAEDVNTLFAVFDRNGNGKITFQEFVDELALRDTQYSRPARFHEVDNGTRQLFDTKPALKNRVAPRSPGDWKAHTHSQDRTQVLRGAGWNDGKI